MCMKRAEFTASVVCATALVAGSAGGAGAAASKTKYRHVKPVPDARPTSHPHRKRRAIKGFKSFDTPGNTLIKTARSFGPPVFFAWDRSTGLVTTALQTDDKIIATEVASLYDSTTVKTAYITVTIPYIHSSSYFTQPPDGPRLKEIVQFKPVVSQIQELPELNKQPLSWGPLMKFDKDALPNDYMFSGPLRDPTNVNPLHDMPIEAGIGAFSCEFAGTALNQNGALVQIEQALQYVNGITTIAAGVPGLAISAATTLAFSTAQNVVDQLIALFANGRAENEYAFDATAQKFAVTDVESASDTDTVRIPKTGAWYILVPGGDPPDTAAQSDAFAADISGKQVFSEPSGALTTSVGDPKGQELFAPYNYIVIHCAVHDKIG